MIDRSTFANHGDFKQIQNQKGKFPSSVEMEVTLVGPGDRILESKVLFNLETPNDVLPKTY